MVSSYISQESEKEMELDPPKYRAVDNRPWHYGILTIEDLMEIDPPRARFLQQLQELAIQKRQILHDNSLSESDKLRQVKIYSTLWLLKKTLREKHFRKVINFLDIDSKSCFAPNNWFGGWPSRTSRRPWSEFPILSILSRLRLQCGGSLLPWRIRRRNNRKC